MDDKNVLLEAVLKDINVDFGGGTSRFLQANPYDVVEFRDYDGKLTKTIFKTFLYFESRFAKEKKKEIASYLTKKDGGKNTIFILGYQGCGKTTFVSSLLDDAACNQFRVSKIDCDSCGIASDPDALGTIFSQSLLSLVSSNHKSFENFITFFHRNNDVLRELSNYREIKKFWKYVNAFVSEGKNIHKNVDNKDDFSDWLKDECVFKTLFYLYVILSLSNRFNEKESDTPVLIFIDNLDNIEEHKDLKLFINAIDDFNLDMNRIFRRLQIYNHGTTKKYSYANKVKIIVAMRETTRAALPPSHTADIFRAIYKSYDITELYDKDDVVNKRLDFLSTSSSLVSDNALNKMRIIRDIMSDRYTKSVFIPLFNNNYRKAITMITKIVHEHINVFDDYRDIMKLSDLRYRYGARGILFKLIIDDFRDAKYLKQIGVLDLQDEVRNINIARVLLSYLSNYTDTKCDDAQNSYPLFELIDELKGIEMSNPQYTMQIVKAMYDLKNSTWTHLVSFSQLDTIGEPSKCNINDATSTVHYSSAGKIFLEKITPHFEFFSSRMKFRQSNDPLFYKGNITKEENGQYKFERIICEVFNAVRGCCNSLMAHNKMTCRRKNHPDPYEHIVGIKPYLDSPHVAQIKDGDKITKRFHEERIIHSHIGYIDTYRHFILNKPEISDSEKIEINKILHGYLDKYVCLLESDAVLVSAKKVLERFRRRLDLIKNDYANFSITVNKSDEDIEDVLG